MHNSMHNSMMCRVDFFKKSGKWYSTESFEMNESHHDGLVDYNVFKSLDEQFHNMYTGMTAVVLLPFHEFGFPIMLKNWNKFEG